MDKNGEEKEIKEPSIIVKKIIFNDGTEIEPNKNEIILFVGPNNVGKSRALKDIKNDLNRKSSDKIIIKEIEYDASNFNEESLTKFIKENCNRNAHGDYYTQIDNVYFSYNDWQLNNINECSRDFYRLLFTYLSTENRLNITKPIYTNDIRDDYSINILKKLEESNELIKKLNKYLLKSFDKAIDIAEDYDNNFLIKKYKIGNKKEIEKTTNTNIRDAKVELKKLEDLNNQGDGIRSSVAILSSLIVNKHSLYLIDEPETFLHPPQARLLGKNIVELAKDNQCFISTHNIDIIRGVLEKDASRIKIIKINRDGNKNEFHILDNSSITKIANDKNLKYSNILNGLFYDQVVLCENESDCKFYSAILEVLDSNIYQNTLFCAVGGKDQFKLVIPLLKKLGIKYLVIADIDLINDRDKLKQLVNAIEPNQYKIIEEAHKIFFTEFEKNTNSLIKKQKIIKEEIANMFTEDEYMPQSVADRIKETLKEINNLKLLKKAGKYIIPQGECIRKFEEIEKFLITNNIFILECGEIERFVPDVNRHGNAWVEEVFRKYKKMDDLAYDSVKRFIKKVFNIEN